MTSRIRKTIVMVTLGFCTGGGVAYAMDNLSADAIWTYFNFDGIEQPLIPAEPFRRVETIGREDAELRYVEGRIGQALSVTADDGFLSITHGRTDFPTSAGSLIFWFKPNRPMRETGRLLDAAWAGFSLHIAGERLMAYATGNHQQFLAGGLGEWSEDWVGNWHMAVMTWSGSRRQLFFNGELIAEREEVEPFDGPNSFRFGLHHRSRDRENPYIAILNGALDEFAVLNTELSPEQVKQFHEQGSGEVGNAVGLLEIMGGAVAVRLERHGFVRGETVRGTISVHGKGDRVDLLAMPEAGGERISLATLPAGGGDFTLDTRDLRPGRYRIRAVLTKNNEMALTSEEVIIGIRAERRPEFPIGLDGLPADDDELLAKAASWKIDHAASGGDVTSALYWRVDRLFSHGISFLPNLNIHWHRSLPLPEFDSYFDPETGRGTDRLREVLQLMVLHGDTSFETYSSSAGSPFSPVTQQAMRRRLTDFLESSKGHPGLVAFSFDDEYVLRMGRDAASGKVYYSDYSQGARDTFRRETGLDPVFPPVEPPGTVFDDDHPYYKWRDIIGMPHDASSAGLAKTHGELTELAHSIRPDVLTTAWSGGEYGIVDVVMDYSYPAIWQPHFGFNFGHGRVDFHKDRKRARQRTETPKPLWGLVGWWSADLSEQPDHIVDDFRLNNIMSLTKGDESITWFTLYMGGILTHEGLKREMIKWADWIHRYGPMFTRFQVLPSRRAAVLLSEDNVAGHIAHTANGMHTFGAEAFYPALRIAGVPVDLVTDRQVKAGVLDDYEALFLYKFNYAGRSLWESIETFAETPGKKVFVDNQTALSPDGAFELPFSAQGRAPARASAEYEHIPYYGTRSMAWMAGELRETVTPQLAPEDLRVSGSNLVAPYWLHSRGKGRGRLLILVNYDTSKAQNVEVFFQAPPDTVVQDLADGSETSFATSSQPVMIWQTEIAPADWKVYWVYGGRLESLEVKASREGDAFKAEIAAFDNHMQPLRSGLPLKIEWFDPDGREVEAYRRYTALNPDTGTLDLFIPRARLMDPDGEWTVAVTETLSGRRSTTTFNSKPEQ
ncbi:MAG: LamG-like jellyroll fold domain-containing protein [Kiritimatiellia bacterium]